MAKAILSSLCVFLLCACSVKEFRGECPCYLNMDFDEIISSGEFRESLVCVESGELFSSENIRLALFESVGYEIRVPRRMVHACVAAGIQKGSRHGDTLSYASNVEMDALYAWNADLECNDDMMYVRPELHKQYCNLILDIVGEDSDYDLVLSAGCNALSFFGLRPIPGEYSAVVKRNGSGRHSIRVPRQKDSWVRLDFVISGGGRFPAKGESVSSFDVGAGMAASGYDWTKEDLDDAVVTVDLVQATVSVRIVDWESENLEFNI